MRISVVIPTLNEAAALPAALARLDPGDPEVEVIVVDGGSADETLAIAAAQGARILRAPRGRGPQLRAGAEAATGAVVLLLHADTRLGPGALAAIRAAMRDEQVAGGNFRLIFDGASGFARWTTRLYARLRRNGIYYGDSAIFLRAEALRRIGGVPPLALMEDWALVSKLERAGRTICIDDPPAVTSSRRFEGRPGWRIVLGWIRIHALYFLGVSGERLARIYRSETARPGDRG